MINDTLCENIERQSRFYNPSGRFEYRVQNHCPIFWSDFWVKVILIIKGFQYILIKGLNLYLQCNVHPIYISVSSHFTSPELYLLQESPYNLEAPLK